jgi:hypothetical protein
LGGLAAQGLFIGSKKVLQTGAWRSAPSAEWIRAKLEPLETERIMAAKAAFNGS